MYPRRTDKKRLKVQRRKAEHYSVTEFKFETDSLKTTEGHMGGSLG